MDHAARIDDLSVPVSTTETVKPIRTYLVLQKPSHAPVEQERLDHFCFRAQGPATPSASPPPPMMKNQGTLFWSTDFVRVGSSAVVRSNNNDIFVSFLKAFQGCQAPSPTRRSRGGSGRGGHGVSGTIHAAEVCGNLDREEAATRVVRAVERTGEARQVRGIDVLCFCLCKKTKIRMVDRFVAQ